MSQVLALASDFIERMSNPAYGVRINEEYSLRFAELLSSEGFDELLRREMRQLRDPDALTPHGWLWLLGWARSKKISLDDKLLLRLTETLTSVFMLVVTIDLATKKTDWGHRNTVVSLHEFYHPWLLELMRRCTEKGGEKDTGNDYIDTKRAETVLIALMQVSSDITVDAASTLLNHHWTGQYQLLRFFWSLCDQFDDETRDMWISRLRPPKL
jgi:hypothetical protein